MTRFEHMYIMARELKEIYSEKINIKDKIIDSLGGFHKSYQILAGLIPRKKKENDWGEETEYALPMKATSWEELWLKIFMLVKYNKSWDDEKRKWVR